MKKRDGPNFSVNFSVYIGSLVGELDLMNVFLVEPLEAAVAEVVDHVVVQSQRVQLLQSCHTNTGWTKVNGQPVPFMIRCQRQQMDTKKWTACNHVY